MSKEKPQSEMITPMEMAKRCCESYVNIMNELRAGTFPVGRAKKMEGGQWRHYVTRAEFEEWMAGRLPSNIARMAEVIAYRLADRIT